MAYQEIEVDELTDAQKKSIVDRWNDKTLKPPSVTELLDVAYGENHGLHPRSKQAKEIQGFLVNSKLGILSKEKAISLSESAQLTDEQKIKIHENLNSEHPISNSDLAAQICNNNQRVGDVLNQIKNYISSIPRDLYGSKQSVLKYRPPESIVEAAHLVNRASYKAIDLNKLERDPVKKEYLSCLIKFLHTFRVALTYESYTDDIEKALFETSFVKFVWDKPDLTPEEIDLYINLCVDIVGCERLKKEEAFLMETRESVSNDSDGRKISMSIVESLAGLRKERDDNQTRQSKTIQMLQGKRSDRIDSRQKENSSVLQLIAAWRDAEKRNRLIKFAEERKELVRGELAKLDSMDLFKAELWGVNPESFDYQSNPETTITEEKHDNI